MLGCISKSSRKEQDVCLKGLGGLMPLLIGEMTLCVFVSAGVCNERINRAEALNESTIIFYILSASIT